MKILLWNLLGSAMLFAQSFYVLSGVDSYDTVVANMSPKTQRYTPQIKQLMHTISKEIGITMQGHPSRVLAVVVRDVSLGSSVGLSLRLELGEYVRRKGSTQRIFALTYDDARLIAPNWKDAEEIEEQLIDAVEEMMDAFKLQYIEDNRKLSKTKKSVTHATFAADMGYETDYKKALAKAKKERKPLMILMTTAYCPWCRKLESRILSQHKIDAMIQAKYVPVMLNLDKDTFPTQFAKSRFTPVIYIVNYTDEKIVRQFTGYSSREAFLYDLEK